MKNINVADDNSASGMTAVGVFGNGMCAVMYNNEVMLVDADLKNVTELPPVEVEAAHGKTEQEDGDVVMTFGNKLVAAVDGEDESKEIPVYSFK